MNTEELKEKWIKNTESLTEIKQDDLRKKLESLTFDELKEKAQKDYQYWKSEGRIHNHDFYYQLASCIPSELRN